MPRPPDRARSCRDHSPNPPSDGRWQGTTGGARHRNTQPRAARCRPLGWQQRTQAAPPTHQGGGSVTRPRDGPDGGRYLARWPRRRSGVAPPGDTRRRRPGPSNAATEEERCDTRRSDDRGRPDPARGGPDLVGGGRLDPASAACGDASSYDKVWGHG
jgi:hypothetical protein